MSFPTKDMSDSNFKDFEYKKQSESEVEKSIKVRRHIFPGKCKQKSIV